MKSRSSSIGKRMVVDNESGIDIAGNTPVINLSTVSDEVIRKNTHTVISCFKKTYGIDPKFVVRVPGRVNLIGEHIDYCGFPVCPMALDKSVYLAIAEPPLESAKVFLRVCNTESDRYHESEITKYHPPKLEISFEKFGWISYLACGVQGVIDKNAELCAFTEPKKMLMAVHSNLPPSAGLSSSSALVCAAFLATAVLNNIQLSKTEIATLCAKAEHYIGTAGGGMDQAIAMNARKGYAKLVKFNPLKLFDVALPRTAILIIANTLADKNKAQSNDFNTRVVECRLAAQVMAKLNGHREWRELKSLERVQKVLDLSSSSEMLVMVDRMFHSEPYTKTEICELLEVTPAELNEVSLTPNTYNVEKFKLKQRAEHVYSEADRVYTWRNWCAAEKSLDELGLLMSKSHFSLQYLYECSHTDLNKLVSIFLMSGAHGARLTGAGWGGCAVALVSQNKIPTIMTNLYDMYYKKIFQTKEEMSKAVFIVNPGEGAEIYIS